MLCVVGRMVGLHGGLMSDIGRPFYSPPYTINVPPYTINPRFNLPTPSRAPGQAH